MDQKVLLTVTHILVTYCIDYFNRLYSGLPLKSIQKCQVIEDAAAWPVMDAPHWPH